MRELIKKNIGGKKVLLLFAVTNMVYVFMLAITIPNVRQFSQGMEILDMMPTGYNTEYVILLLNTLGEQGRYFYLYRQIPVDLIYPSLFGISSCLILAYFLNKLKKLEGGLFYLCFIPLFSGLFDYCENIGIILILNSFPAPSDLLIKTTSVFSVLKSTTTVCYFIILTGLLIVLGVSKFFKKPADEHN